MAADITKNIVRTTSIGAIKPLTYVSTYHYIYDGERVEITASVRDGNTTHKFELSLSTDCAKKLAGRIMEELQLTPADLTEG